MAVQRMHALGRHTRMVQDVWWWVVWLVWHAALRFEERDSDADGERERSTTREREMSDVRVADETESMHEIQKRYTCHHS